MCSSSRDDDDSDDDDNSDSSRSSERDERCSGPWIGHPPTNTRHSIDDGNANQIKETA